MEGLNATFRLSRIGLKRVNGPDDCLVNLHSACGHVDDTSIVNGWSLPSPRGVWREREIEN